MLNKQTWNKIFKEQDDFDISRRKIISESNNALHLAKQSIFALQRGSKKEADDKLAEATEALISLDKRFGDNAKLRMEGAWKAAVEEYAEAKLFMDFMKGEDLGPINKFYVSAEEYLGGLSDTTGEIVRMMIIWTTENKITKVKKSAKVVSEILHLLMQRNFTGYLRTKFDQAKKNLQKSESILYDLSIRDK